MPQRYYARVGLPQSRCDVWHYGPSADFHMIRTREAPLEF